jgi:hypothetical protein
MKKTVLQKLIAIADSHGFILGREEYPWLPDAPIVSISFKNIPLNPMWEVYDETPELDGEFAAGWSLFREALKAKELYLKTEKRDKDQNSLSVNPIPPNDA